MVTLNSKDRYEIIGRREVSDFIKQPCRNVCLKSARNASKLLKQCTLAKHDYYDLQQAFKISSLAQISSACQPAVRSSSARHRPLDFSQVMHGCIRFLNFSIC